MAARAAAPGQASLLDALGVGRGEMVCVVGAGGKTTLVYALAAQAHARGWRVIVTTTTHMGTLPGATTGPIVVRSEQARPGELEAALARAGRATLLGRRVRPDKLAGLPCEAVGPLLELCDLVLVEADGARGRSLKAPAEHEPVVPGRASRVVVVAALDVLGAEFGPVAVHRHETLAAATGRAAGGRVDADLVVAALAHPDGYTGRVPAGARRLVFLNKAETPAARVAGASIGARLVPPYDAAVLGSARSGWACGAS